MKQVVEKDKMIDPRFLWKNRAASMTAHGWWVLNGLLCAL